jgi:hypothetical protein
LEDQTAHLLLAEFRAFRDTEWREFRDDVGSWKQDTAGRLASLETQVKSGITGGGQPSRLAVVEASVEDLNRFRYWWMGASAAIGSIGGALVSLFFAGGKH